MFFTLLEVALIECAILPLLSAPTVFQIVAPTSNILGTILVEICPKPIGSIIKEFTFIDIAIQVIECSLAVCFAISPLALILCSVFP